MSSALNWRTDGPSSSDAAVFHLRDTAFDNRIEALREMALLFLSELESLRSTTPSRGNLSDEVHRFEVDLIRSALERTGGNQVRAARLLGVKPTTLNAKLKRHKISFPGGEARAEPDVDSHEMAA